MAKNRDDVVDSGTITAEIKAEPKVDPLAVLASTVGDKVYEWPLEKADSMHDAFELGHNFIKQNLKDGQKFSYNWQYGSMFFLPECGIKLNPDNPTWTYNEATFDKNNLGALFHCIRTGSLIPGDYQVSRIVPVVMPSKIDCSKIDNLNDQQIRNELKKIITQKTTVTSDGKITSPGADVDALIKHEKENRNRKSVMEMLYEAQKRTRSAVAFLDEEDIKREDERLKKSAANPVSANRPDKSVKVGVGSASNVASLI